MNLTKSIVMLFTLIFFVSCSSQEKKFEGKWKPKDGRPAGLTVNIEKDKKAYKLTLDFGGGDIEEQTFLYNKDLDVLYMDTGKEIIDVKYLSETKNLRMETRGGGGWDQSIELEKVALP